MTHGRPIASAGEYARAPPRARLWSSYRATRSCPKQRVEEGYLVVNSNTGHDDAVEPGYSFAFNNRQVEIDFAIERRAMPCFFIFTETRGGRPRLWAS